MIININEIDKIKGENIVICAGWFDLFHIGHLNFLKNAKNQGDTLVVLVMNDLDGRAIKGETRPIINESERCEIIDNIKCVDYTILSDNDTTNSNYLLIDDLDLKSRILWERYISIIEKIKPSKVFALEETLKFNCLDEYIESIGVSVVYSDRFEGISTTDIELKLKTNK